MSLANNPLVTEYQTDVQYRDLDPLGHVNNAVYLSWMENSRVKYLKRWGMVKRAVDIDAVVARIELDFVAPVFEDSQVSTFIWCSRVGGKSLDYSYGIYANRRLCAKGLSVIVTFDSEQQKAAEIPEKWRPVLTEQAEQLGDLEPPAEL